MPGLNGLVVMTPTSIVSTGTGNSSSIGANGKVTFSSCNTLSLNGVFTSSYDNYMIVTRGKSATSYPYSYIRLRVNGVDNSTASSYVSQYLNSSSTSVGAGRLTDTRTSEAFYASLEGGATVFFFGPNLAQPTAFRSVTTVGDGAAAWTNWDVASTHNQSTAYDGFSIVMQGTHSASGLITVYGFNQ